MIEENPGAMSDRRQAQEIIIMNDHIIKLIKNKTIPLNKERFHYLRKIAQVRKSQPQQHSLQPQENQLPYPPVLKKSQTSRSCGKVPTMETLINRLKNLKQLRNNSQLMKTDVEAQICWQNLRRSILSNSQPSITPRSIIQTQKQTKSRFCQYKQSRVILKDVIDRTQRHLRLQKHSLKERHYRMEEQKRRREGESDIQRMLNKLKGEKKNSWYRFVTSQQLQKQLLVDIKENFLQSNFNRIKRDINHKKIVRMR